MAPWSRVLLIGEAPYGLETHPAVCSGTQQYTVESSGFEHEKEAGDLRW